MSRQTPIYLDYQATTPVASEVLEAMLPYFSEVFGNAASKTHVFGWKAQAAVEVATEHLAGLLQVEPETLIHTSGATESNNLALLGVARAWRGQGDHLVTVATEHKAVLDPCKQLEKEGFSVTYLGVNEQGHLDLQGLRQALTPKTLLVSVMAANNEIGTLAPLKKISEITREAGVLLHSDGAQMLGKLPLHPKELGVDLLSLSAHKFYGPKGVGALYVAKGRPTHSLKPILWGGGHQGGLRSGTLNVPGIVGLGRAAQLAGQEMEGEAERQAELRHALLQEMKKKIPEIWVNGDLEQRLPGNLNVGFKGVASDKLLMAVKDLALSAGSACTSDRPEPSHVLKALGLSDEAVHSSIRIGLGRQTTLEEVQMGVERLVQAVAEIRAQEGIDF